MKRLSRSGFSLIELIMIIVVSAIAIPVLLVMMGERAKMGVRPELQVTGANLGQAVMEGVKTKGFTSIGSFANTVTLGGITYTQSVAVCNVPEGDINSTASCNTASDYKRITVTVTGSNISTEVITLVTKYR